MDLHGDFTGPKVISDLLIEHARDHQSHDLALAWGEQLVALSQPAELTLLLAGDTIAVQSLVHCVHQVLIPERLVPAPHSTPFLPPPHHRTAPLPSYTPP